MKKLAILGGEPAFTSPLHVGRPNMGDRQQFIEYVNQIFERRWLSNRGPLVEQFEQELGRKLGVRHCITVCNATIGLQIAIQALELRGEVIVPSFTFVATAHALQWQGITPVFADIDSQTHTLDPAAVEERITPRTSGIIGVHLWGRPCDIDGLSQLARRYNLKLLFDAAHAFGCSYQGKSIGHFGDVEVFSFHATKFFNSFEGGAIVTNNGDLAAKIERMSDFGFSGRDNVISLGTNGKMTEPCAAMGLVNLHSVDEFAAINQRNYGLYQQMLAQLPGFHLIRYDETERCNFQYIAIEVDETQTGIGRDDIVTALRAENVLARRYFWPGCHRMEPYRTVYPNTGLALPQTEIVASRIMVLPTGTAMSEIEITRIGDILRATLAQSDAVRGVLHGDSLKAAVTQ